MLLLLRLYSVQGFPLYEDTDFRRAATHQLYCFAIEVGFGDNAGQSKVGAIAAKASLDQLFVQYMCTVIDEINGNYLQLP